MKLTLLTGDNCHGCDTWKRELKKAGFEFREFNLFNPSKACLEFQVEHKLFVKSVPVLVMIDGKGEKHVYHVLSYSIRNVIQILKGMEV